MHAFAYKPVFFSELPREALEYAEKMNFPILEFGDDEFFEEIIFSIRGLIEKTRLSVFYRAFTAGNARQRVYERRSGCRQRSD